MTTAPIVSLRKLRSTVAPAPPEKFATWLRSNDSCRGTVMPGRNLVANFFGGRWRSRRRGPGSPG